MEAILSIFFLKNIYVKRINKIIQGKIVKKWSVDELLQKSINDQTAIIP